MVEVTLKFKNLQVKHLDALIKITEKMTLKTKIEVISEILGIDKATLYRCEYNAISSIFEAITKDLERCMLAKHVKHFELNGQRYKFVEEVKQPVGWEIDVEAIDKTPENIMALYYLEEECNNYSEVNDDGTQKFNTYERAEKLKEADLAIYVGLSKYLKKKWDLTLKIMQKMMELQVLTIK